MKESGARIANMYGVKTTAAYIKDGAAASVTKLPHTHSRIV
jgi:hypothetical protein